MCLWGSESLALHSKCDKSVAKSGAPLYLGILATFFACPLLVLSFIWEIKCLVNINEIWWNHRKKNAISVEWECVTDQWKHSAEKKNCELVTIKALAIQIRITFPWRAFIRRYDCCESNRSTMICDNLCLIHNKCSENGKENQTNNSTCIFDRKTFWCAIFWNNIIYVWYVFARYITQTHFQTHNTKTQWHARNTDSSPRWISLTNRTNFTDKRTLHWPMMNRARHITSSTKQHLTIVCNVGTPKI